MFHDKPKIEKYRLIKFGGDIYGVEQVYTTRPNIVIFKGSKIDCENKLREYGNSTK